MIRPSWSLPDVFALNALQNSMMLTPCGPSAVPTGGAGVAFPAGICSFTEPVTFFAIPKTFLYSLGLRGLFDLQEVQFHRSCPAKNRNQNPQSIALGIDL